MPVTIDTSTSTERLADRLIGRTANGNLWATNPPSAAGVLEFWYSTDDGASWAQSATAFPRSIRGDEVVVFIDIDDYLHVIFGDEVNGDLAYRRGTPNGARTDWSWSGQQQVAAGAATSLVGLDIVAHQEQGGTGWHVHIVWGNNGWNLFYRRGLWTSGGTFSWDIAAETLFTAQAANTCKIKADFNHTGDGKTIAGAAPHLYIVYTRTTNGVFFKKKTYSGGWGAWGTERNLDAGDGIGPISGLFDGSRMLVAYRTDADPTIPKVAERDAADTTTTVRTPTVLSDGTIDGLSVTYRQSNSDIHLLAVGATSQDLKRIAYDRAGNAWDGSWTTVETGTVKSPATKRGSDSGSKAAAIDMAWLEGTASPFNLRHDRVTFPTVVAVGLASESETSQAIAIQTIATIAIGSVSEIEAASVVSPVAVITIAVGVASEVEAAQAVAVITGAIFPSAPVNLIASPVSETQIDLSWEAVDNADFYDIERDAAIIVKDHATTTYSDTGLSPNTQYSYRVRAVKNG